MPAPNGSAAGEGAARGSPAEAGGERWGRLVVDRASRFVVAHASGPRDQGLAERAVAQARARSGGRPLLWCSDGWRPYPPVLRRT